MFRKKTGGSSNLRKRTTQVLPTEDTGVANNDHKAGQNENDDSGIHLKRHIGQSFGPSRSKFAKRTQLQTRIQEKQQEAEQSHIQNNEILQKPVPSASVAERSKVDSDDDDVEMFTKEEIAKVRAEKQMMRSKMNEFIPIRTNEVTGKHVNTTIMFGVPNDTTDNSRLGRGTTLADLVDGGNSSDSEGDGSDSDSWVMEQVSKGTTKQSIEMLRQEYNQKKNSNNTSDNVDILFGKKDQLTGKKVEQKSSAPFGALNFRFIKYSTREEITKEIDASIQTLSENIRSSEARIAGYQKDIDETLQDIEKSKAQTTENEKNHAFFCQLNEFVRNIVDFLTEKAPEIENIEQRLADLQNEHSAFHKSQLDVLIQRAESMTFTTMTPYDPTGKAHADLSDLLTLIESGKAAEEQTRFNEAKVSLLDEATELLSDTTDEYKSIDNVLKPFAQWKGNPTTAASYRQAYCSMVMPMLLAPLVRYELLSWDPLSPQQKISDMKWFKSIKDFCDETTLDGEKDPDAELLHALVNSSVLPKVKGVILNGDWSPFIREQNETAIQLVKSITEIDKSDDLISGIHEDILTVLQDAVESVKLPDASKYIAVGSKEILERLVKRAINLFGCVCEWSQVMSNGSSTLQRLVIDNFLNTKLLPYIKTLCPKEAYDVSYVIIEKLPKEWKVKTLPSLKFFINLVESLISSTKKDLTIHFT